MTGNLGYFETYPYCRCCVLNLQQHLHKQLFLKLFHRFLFLYFWT